MKKTSAVALNLLWLRELHTEWGAGVWGEVRESPENHKWRGSGWRVTTRSWQKGSWWEALKVVGLIKEKLGRTLEGV